MECYEIQDVSFYPRGDGAVLGECLRKHYEKIVVDFGVLGEQEKAELLRCQKVYLVISFSEWQEGAFGNQNHWEQEAVTYGWHCLAAFGSEESRRKWNRYGVLPWIGFHFQQTHSQFFQSRSSG